MIGLQVDSRILGLLERIATSLESIASTLKPNDEINPADVAKATATLHTSSEALRKTVEEHPAPGP